MWGRLIGGLWWKCRDVEIEGFVSPPFLSGFGGIVPGFEDVVEVAGEDEIRGVRLVFDGMLVEELFEFLLERCLFLGCLLNFPVFVGDLFEAGELLVGGVDRWRVEDYVARVVIVDAHGATAVSGDDRRVSRRN